MITDITEFDSTESAENPVVLYFTATWCGPCKMYKPVLEKISEEYGLDVRRVDVDDSPQIAADHLVRSVPTLVLYRDGGVAETIVGAKPKAFLVKELGLSPV